jgi:3-oxoacyl-[acyl-carrier-protein] synthase III
MPNSAVITSTGSYLPDKIIANRDLTQFPKNALPLIEQKTGVRFRRFAEAAQCTSDLAIAAAQRCLAKTEITAPQLDAIILATSSPDRIQPATATRVQDALGAAQAFAFDLNSVCSGAIYSLAVADAFIKTGFCQNVLVIAAEVYSKILDPTDFTTFPYFGDGAGAILLSASDQVDRGIRYSLLKTDGSKADVIRVPAGGTMLPYHQMKNPKDIYFKMAGREVYEFAVTKGTEIIKEVLENTGLSKADLKYLILHQANINIIQEISRRVELGMDKFVVNLEKYGNTAAASVLITLDELLAAGKVARGELLLLAAFGGGLSWGATLIKY